MRGSAASVLGAIPRWLVNRNVRPLAGLLDRGTNGGELLGRQEPDVPLRHRVRPFARSRMLEQSVHDLEATDPTQPPQACPRTYVGSGDARVVDGVHLVTDADRVARRVLAQHVFDVSESDAALGEIRPQLLQERADTSLGEIFGIAREDASAKVDAPQRVDALSCNCLLRTPGLSRIQAVEEAEPVEPLGQILRARR